jgi:hypothetical protein
MRIGTKRADGMFFRGYRSNGTEHWISEAAYLRRKAKTNEWSRENRKRIQQNPEAKAAYNLRMKEWQKTARRKNPARYMLTRAKIRSKQKGIPFDLILADIEIPEYCPVLGLKLSVSSEFATDTSPELDRIDPDKGYVRGNIIIVSRRVNRIKNDATIAELQQIASFYLTFKPEL